MSFLREGMVGMYFIGGPLDGQPLPEMTAELTYYYARLPMSFDVVRYYRQVYQNPRSPGLAHIFFVKDGMLAIDIDAKAKSYLQHA